MKFGVQLYSLRSMIEENGLEPTLRMVSEAGFEGVEFAGFYEKSGDEIAALLRKYRLSAISAHVGAEELEAQLPILKTLGIKTSVIPYLGFNKGLSLEEGLRICRRADALVKANGMALGYHNHAHEFLNGADAFSRLMECVPDMKFELDVFWLAVAGIDAVAYMRAHKDRLCYLHVKELGKDQNDFNLVLGEGRANLRAVLSCGREFGVEWSILETERMEIPVDEYLKRCYAFMKEFA